MKNTSSRSYGHCRLADHLGLEELVRRSVSQLGEDREKMEFIYSRTDFIPALLNELGIEFEQRSFGIIPKSSGRGGSEILRKLQDKLDIKTNTELIYFEKNQEGGFNSLLDRVFGINIIKSKYLVLATGGYAGNFKNTDNARYNSYNIFDIVRKNNGKIINTSCIFLHPFGYDRGTKVLIGKEAKNGEFVDSNGNLVFSPKTRAMIKEDRYHEIFDQLLEQADECRLRGSPVYFVNSEKREEITPCVHYTSGGIMTDYFARVINVPNLFAIGECQANGSRNNGRFPGYPFTSAIVYGKVLGEFFAGKK